jgi:hypothetical protein
LSNFIHNFGDLFYRFACWRFGILRDSGIKAIAQASDPICSTTFDPAGMCDWRVVAAFA